MRVALIGPSQSGKSSLFAAVAAAGGSNVDLSRPDQPHLAVVKVPDDRLDFLAAMYNPKKYTPAEIEFVDLPGFDLSDEVGRKRAKDHWPAMRNADMLVLVLRAFENPSVAAYRDRIDPQKDLDELLSEFLFADLEQVTNRVDKLEAALKKPSPKRDEQARELELMSRLKDALENEKPIAQAVQNDAEAKLLKSFAFLTEKPALVVVNYGEADLGKAAGVSQLGKWPAMGLSARIEEEIAQLPAEDRGAFLADLGIASSARDRLIQACYRQMKLVSFLTAGEDEVRAWTIIAGTDAVTAAAEIHSDIARGFIRAETVSFTDLQTLGDMKAVKAAGKTRLEGKTYIVQDGDIINFRFAV